MINYQRTYRTRRTFLDFLIELFLLGAFITALAYISYQFIKFVIKHFAWILGILAILIGFSDVKTAKWFSTWYWNLIAFLSGATMLCGGVLALPIAQRFWISKLFKKDPNTVELDWFINDLIGIGVVVGALLVSSGLDSLIPQEERNLAYNNRHLERAKAAIAQENCEGAISLLNSMYPHPKTDSERNKLLKQCKLKMAPVWFERAQSRLVQKDFEAAEELLRKIPKDSEYYLQAQEKLREVYYNHALYLFKQKNYEKAREYFTKTVGYAKSDLYLKKCEKHIKKSKYRQAIRLYKQKNYIQSRKIFEELGNYKKSQWYLKRIERKLEKLRVNQQKSGLTPNDEPASNSKSVLP